MPFIMVQKTSPKPRFPCCSVIKAEDGKVLTSLEGIKKYQGERKIVISIWGEFKNEVKKTSFQLT